MPPYEILHRGQLITKASKALILLHGRGGSARGIMDLADLFCDDHFYIAAPQAPNGSWYPHSFLEEEKLNEPSLTRSIENIKNLIETVAHNISTEHIYLMGFSQGACLTLEVSARMARKYGGIIAFTGGLIGSTINENKYHGNFEGTKIFMSNSENDPHVPLARSEQSKAVMEKLRGDVTLKIYKGRAHTIAKEEITLVKKNFF